MPDRHRIRFVGYCARREIQELIKISKQEEENEKFDFKVLEIETYSDQLEHQSNLLSSTYHHSISIEPIQINTKSRKVIWAITQQNQSIQSKINNRFMNGPVPTWLRNQPKH